MLTTNFFKMVVNQTECYLNRKKSGGELQTMINLPNVLKLK